MSRGGSGGGWNERLPGVGARLAALLGRSGSAKAGQRSGSMRAPLAARVCGKGSTRGAGGQSRQQRRMARLRARLGDVTIKSTNNSSENLCNDLNTSAGNSLKIHTIRLGLFSLDLKNNIMEQFDIPWSKTLIVGAHFQRKQKTIVQPKQKPT